MLSHPYLALLEENMLLTSANSSPANGKRTAGSVTKEGYFRISTTRGLVQAANESQTYQC